MKKLAMVLIIFSSILMGVAGGGFVASRYYETQVDIADSIDSLVDNSEGLTTRDYYIDIEKDPDEWKNHVSIHFYGTTKREALSNE